jgi:2-dehydro-3-deoxygluconokinase
MNKVVTFGEIMLRLSPPGKQRFIQAVNYDVTYGGGEANVAVSLANYGIDSCFVTKVPEHEIGQGSINHLRQYGVNTNYITRGGKRLGIYFLEIGASQRPSKVIYDRENSSIAQIRTGEFDWEKIFEGAKWFHFTGITPALGDGPTEVILEALKVAQDKKIKVSVDLNYRKNLWSSEKANQVMTKIMEYVDVIIGNEEDAEKVFGIKATGSDITSGKLSEDGYRNVARQLFERFQPELVAITLRESISASDNNWSSLIYNGEDLYRSKIYKIHIVDRVGGGDAFSAGLIYSILTEKSHSEATEFATAASCLKHSIEGDFNLMNVKEIERLLKGDASGRVQR